MTDKVTFAPVSTFTNDTTAVTQTNANYTLMQTALDNTLSRDGTTPNQMGAAIDMNNNRVMNLPAPGGPNEPLRLADVITVPFSVVYGSPSAQVGTAAVNGAATTVMRSDAAPPINQAMTPTWTGKHIFSAEVDLNSTVKVSGTTETFPASGLIVGTTDSQTLTNKTLTTPVISTISNTGTLTLPTSTDTLVGRATTDTLTNKTLTSPTITGTGTIGSGAITSTGAIAGTAVTGTSLGTTGTVTALSGTATTAGGATSAALAMGTAGFGIFFGSGAPTITAPQGSLYIRSDGSSTSTRMYINTTGSTVWTAVTTAA